MGHQAEETIEPFLDVVSTGSQCIPKNGMSDPLLLWSTVYNLEIMKILSRYDLLTDLIQNIF